MTDVVGSTKTVEHLGDRAWGEVVAEHERVTRAEITLFAARRLDTTGDGFLVAFESAARAIRCALALLDRLTELGLTIRPASTPARSRTSEAGRAASRCTSPAGWRTRIRARSS